MPSVKKSKSSNKVPSDIAKKYNPVLAAEIKEMKVKLDAHKNPNPLLPLVNELQGMLNDASSEIGKLRAMVLHLLNLMPSVKSVPENWDNVEAMIIRDFKFNPVTASVHGSNLFVDARQNSNSSSKRTHKLLSVVTKTKKLLRKQTV